MFKLLTLSIFLLLSKLSPAKAIEIVQISHSVLNDDRYHKAENVRVNGDGRLFFYQANLDYYTTGVSHFTDEDHIWKTSNVWLGMSPSDHVNELVSDYNKPFDKHAKNVAIDYKGNRVCYESNVPEQDNIILSDFSDGTKKMKNITYHTDAKNYSQPRKSFSCDISFDGSTIVFESDADLMFGVQTAYKKFQIYMTKDDGDSFSIVTPKELSTLSVNSGPVVSGDGSYVAFRSTMQSNITDTPSSAKDEAWLYRSSDGALTRVTNFQEQDCNTTLIYEKMIELWGRTNLNAQGISSVTTSECSYAAGQGWIPSTGTIGIGYRSQKISNDGRFMTYTANFDAATIRGTHELSNLVGDINLFLYDAVLGFTWRLTKEGRVGESSSKSIEEYCCPTAATDKKRGSCSLKDEMKGYCCWQKPCAFPALNSDISGDGNSIAFESDFDLMANATENVKNGLAIAHYYIPTSTLTHITHASDRNDKSLFPSISYEGNVVAYTHRLSKVADKIFAAKLVMGCSRDMEASNYHATPDVEVCCKYNNVNPERATGAFVRLEFETDLSEALRHIAFFQDVDATARFCTQYVNDVKSDVACSLAIPHSMIKIVSPSKSNPCGDWMNTGIEVELILISFGSRTDLSLKKELERQHNDPDSFLWKGYLTKTLKVAIEASSLSPSTLSPTKSTLFTLSHSPSTIPSTKPPAQKATGSPSITHTAKFLAATSTFVNGVFWGVLSTAFLMLLHFLYRSLNRKYNPSFAGHAMEFELVTLSK